METAYFFILGGQDNEMAEIKSVLTSLNIPYIQPQSKWGEIVVSTTDLPQSAQDKQLVFVECKPKIHAKDAILIDHHNHLSNQPSSLLQVLKLLNIKPNLNQQIIASIDSDFLYHTIKKFPKYKSKILKIWETGYRKNFTSDQEFQIFKSKCQQLIDAAYRPFPSLLIIYEAPQSMTLISAICNLQNLACILIVGSRQSDKLKPCFYQGPKSVIKKISQYPWQKAYWGKRYFGCRAIPSQFITFINQIYNSQLTN